MGRHRLAARLILVASMLLTAAVLLQLLLKFQRGRLFPGDDQRYDVGELYMAPMADVCDKGAKVLSASAFEACLPGMSLAEGARSPAFRKVPIPTLSGSMDAAMPSFRRLLGTRGETVLEGLLKGAKPYVIGLRLPRRLFVPNALGVESNVLVFAALQDGRVCFFGRCPYLVSRFDQNALVFPLVAPTEGAASTPDDMVDVFIFARDSAFPIGLVLQDGVFATSFESMYSVRKLYPIAIYGRPAVFAILFIGLFLMALGFAVIWNEFFDYGAFCYMAASFALTTLVREPVMMVMGRNDLFLWRQLYGFGLVNLLAATVCFALAVTRMRGRKILLVLAALDLAGTAFVLTAMPTSTAAAAAAWFKGFESSMSFALLVAPASIAFHGAWSCLRRYRRARGGGPLSLQLDFKRRTVELALHGSFLLSIGLELWSSALLAGSGMQEYWRFSPLTGTFLFAIFAVLLYHSTTKLAKTHFRTDGRSEAVRLKGRLSTQRYMQWLAEPRQGIMLQVDLKNSSIAASSLKSRIHTLMQSLCDAMRASHQALGYHWILAKKNGDEWIVILSPKHAALKDDLEEVTLATLAEAPAWRRLVQSVAPESSVHVNVFALTTYTLSDGQASVEGSAAAEHETESNWDVLDFASREANYLMKWGGKSRHTGTVILGCNASLLTPALKGLTEDTQKLSRLIAAQDGAAPESVFDAESLGLILAYLPCSDEASVPDDTNGLAS